MAKNNRLMILEEQLESFNAETGEIKSRRHKQVRKSSLQPTDEFIKVSKYLNVIFAYNDIPLSLVPISLLLAQRMVFRTNEIVLLKDDKEELAEMLNCTLRNVEKQLKDCKQFDILRQRARGKYTINPYLFNTGSVAEVRDLQAWFDFDSDTYGVRGTLENKLNGETVRRSIANKDKKQIPGQLSLNDLYTPEEI